VLHGCEAGFARDVGSAGIDFDVEAFGFVVTLGDGVVETALFGLGIPVGLEFTGSEARSVSAGV
jgi:hypothetical protein